jgi:copper chaperone
MITFIVTGMSCGHCAQAITKAVKTLDPEATITIELDKGRVQIDSDLPADEFQAAINALDYSAVPA